MTKTSVSNFCAPKKQWLQSRNHMNYLSERQVHYKNYKKLQKILAKKSEKSFYQYLTNFFQLRDDSFCLP